MSNRSRPASIYPAIPAQQRTRVVVTPGDIDEETARARFSVYAGWRLVRRAVLSTGATTWTQCAFVRA